jgi:hypothetical protein
MVELRNMANKPQSNRQKLVFRLEPSQAKPRKPIAVAMRQNGAGSHQKPVASIRQKQKIALKKMHAEGEPE